MLTFFTIILCNFLWPAGAPAQPEPVIIEGYTMGTSYRIIYFDASERNFKPEVDSLLHWVNKAINTYDPESEISRFNTDDDGICIESAYLYEILKAAKRIYRGSGGAFDPTVMPLVNAWGFGPDKSLSPGDAVIDSLKALTGFNRVSVSRKRVRKKDPRTQLDMGGLGQGFGADVIFRYLRAQGIENMLVELGGEGVASGKNLQKDRAWTIGILNPHSTPDHQYFKAYVTLNDRAFTTSGNYFNYRIVDGRKFGHTIDPRSGRPVQHSLLSASVFAPDCTTADGWATAFMVMGIDKAIAAAKKLKGVDVMFIYSTEEGELATYVSPQLTNHIVLE